MIRAQGWIGATTLLAVATLALSACRRGGDDPLATSSGADAVFAVVTCEHANPDGSCNKGSCKQDQQGNCQTFADNCIKNGHHYSGTAKEGTCSRVL